MSLLRDISGLRALGIFGRYAAVWHGLAWTGDKALTPLQRRVIAIAGGVATVLYLGYPIATAERWLSREDWELFGFWPGNNRVLREEAASYAAAIPDFKANVAAEARRLIVAARGLPSGDERPLADFIGQAAL